MSHSLLLYTGWIVFESLHTFHKTVNMIDGSSYGGSFRPVMADADEISVLLKRIQGKRFLPDQVNVVGHVGTHISPKDDVTVITHAQIVDRNCEMVKIFFKYIPISPIVFFF